MSKIKIFALGGLNESGKNMYVVEVNNNIYVFDAGQKYAEASMLGIDYIIPNFDYIKENIKRVKGIFLTHGHEENMGAIYDIILEIPEINIYATKFTCEIIKKELEILNVTKFNLHEIEAHRKVDFEVESIFPIALTHSIPDNVGFVLTTEDGTIFYTGDYVFDGSMTGSYKADIGKLAYIGKKGVLCLLSESVYSEKEGHTSPKHRISPLIKETLIRNNGRIIVSLFQSHIYRMQELLNEVSKTDRKIVLMGKNFQESIVRAIDMGYIEFDKKRIGSLSNVEDANSVILISNDRERPFSNLERIINGYDKFVKIHETDTVLFLDSIYEALEKKYVKLANAIAKEGAHVVTLSASKYLQHHASKEDLRLMLNLINPKYYMPVKGEYRYQMANANIAKELGMDEKNVLLKLNGEVVTFERGILVENTDVIKTEDILIDGNTTEDIGQLVIKDREFLRENGIIIVAAIIDRKTKQLVSGPEIVTRGFIYVKDNGEIIDKIKELSTSVIKAATASGTIDFASIKNNVREQLGKYLYQATECKPMIISVIHEI